LNDPLVLIEIDLPHLLAAESFPFGADGTGAGIIANRARRQQPPPDAGMNRSYLPGLVDRSAPDLLLRVVAEPHLVLVMQVQQIARLRIAYCNGIRQQILAELVRNAIR